MSKFIVQVHSTDKQDYINEYDDFKFNTDYGTYINDKGVRLSDYVMELVFKGENDKVVVKKYFR